MVRILDLYMLNVMIQYKSEKKRMFNVCVISARYLFSQTLFHSTRISTDPGLPECQITELNSPLIIITEWRVEQSSVAREAAEL